MDNLIPFPSSYQGKKSAVELAGLDIWKHILVLGLDENGTFQMFHDPRVTPETAIFILEFAKRMIMKKSEEQAFTDPPRGA